MITVEVDASRAVVRFGAMPDRVRQRLRDVIIEDTGRLVDRVRDKLTPGNLFKTTSRLLPSIKQQLVENPAQIYGRVFSNWNSPVPAVLEYGAKPHEIVAKNATALAFMLAGEMRFFKRVNHPGFAGRSYMRSSLDEIREQLITDMKAAVIGAANVR